MQYRYYGFGNVYLSQIQQGIQAAINNIFYLNGNYVILHIQTHYK